MSGQGWKTDESGKYCVWMNRSLPPQMTVLRLKNKRKQKGKSEDLWLGKSKDYNST